MSKEMWKLVGAIVTRLTIFIISAVLVGGYFIATASQPNPDCINREIGDGAYFFSENQKNGDCFFVPVGETDSIPFNPKSVYIRGGGITIDVCGTDRAKGIADCLTLQMNVHALSLSGRTYAATVIAGPTPTPMPMPPPCNGPHCQRA